MGPSAPSASGDLDDLVVAARTAWPGVNVPAEVFLAWVEERLGPDEDPAALFTSDLYLACACVRHDRAALAALETTYLTELPRWVGHLRLSPAHLDDLAQQLRSELLVAEPGALPKLASYRAQGPLGGWIRITAIRAGLRMLPRHETTSSEDDRLSELVAPQQSPELAFLKTTDQAAFKAAFHAAMRSLPPKEQNLLRQHYVDGLSIDRLGEVYGMHRTSSARWLRQARETLLQTTKAHLMRQTRATASECESMIRQAQSQLEITFRSLFD